MTDETSSVQRHYGSGDLVGRILSALEEAGHDTSNPTVEMLNVIDQLHGGGLQSTKNQAELAGVTGDMRVLDAGCGVGGSSRYLAHVHGCQIDALDLTQEFVETASRLNELCGLQDKIVTRQGSVTDLPYDDGSFDLVWCQNVTMNVADKPGMFAEAHRVLAPGGRYTFSHAAQGPGGDPLYPLPWAREPTYSFLGTSDDVLGWLEDAGFKVLASLTEGGGAGGKLGPPPGIVIPEAIMGADFPERLANSIKSAEENRLVGMLVLAERV